MTNRRKTTSGRLANIRAYLGRKGKPELVALLLDLVLGVTPGNVLVASPHPRNPLLADAIKRIGLVECSGRGVGIIYHSQLQNGRMPPSYDRSTTSMVTIALILDLRIRVS